MASPSTTDSLKNCLLNEKNIEAIVKINIEISYSYLASNIDSSIYFIKEAEDIIRKNEETEFGLEIKEKFAATYTEIAWIEYSTNSYRASDYFFNKALNYYQETLDTFNIADTYYGLAMCNKYWGRYRKAVMYAQKGYDYFLMIDSKIGLADMNLLLVYIYAAWNNFEQSNIYCDKVFEILKETNHVELLTYAYLGKGGNYFGLSNADSAMIYYKKALQLFEDYDDIRGMALCYRNMARYYMYKNDFQNAESMINKSLKIFIEINDKRSISELYILKGKYLSKLKRYTEALNYYLKGQELALSIELYEEIIKNYKYISEAYESLNNEKLAFKYFKQYNAIKDSIFTAEKFEQITDMQTKYETQKKEQENIILKKELVIKSIEEQKSKSFQRFLFIVLAISILVIILLYILFRLRTKTVRKTRLLMEREKQLAELKINSEKEINKLIKIKHEAEIVYKNEELSSSILHLINKNETLGKIKRILVTEKNKVKPDYQECDKKLLSIINNNIDIDLDWKKFNLNFEKVHKGFMSRLVEKNPDLSENEQRLCAYLKINITSKEIAQIMNITVDSVSKNRQRLRKKLITDEQIELKEYIQDI
jgi:tetratricopeptide (TPR) repeat protein/DNA-binding CsgD family transcriptional regulator